MSLRDDINSSFQRIHDRVNGAETQDHYAEEDRVEQEEQDAKATDTAALEYLTGVIRDAQDNDNDARLTMGEAGAIAIEKFGYGALIDICEDTHVVYKTLAERAEVVAFYQNSAGQNLTLFESDARDLIADNPTLQWTHLRDARRLGDRGKAIAGLQKAIKEGWTPSRFQEYIKGILGKPERRHLCVTCTLWDDSNLEPIDGKRWGVCRDAQLKDSKFGAWDSGFRVPVKSREDFGCNQWEKK